MRQVGPASAALRPAVDSSNLEVATRNAAVLQKAFTDTETFWKAKKAEPTLWAQNARKEVEAVQAAGFGGFGGLGGFGGASGAPFFAELEKQETYDHPGRAQEINRDLMDVQHRLAELNPQWEQQATRLAALE